MWGNGPRVIHRQGRHLISEGKQCVSCLIFPSMASTHLWMWERGGRLVWVWPPASVLNVSSLRSKLSKNVSRFSFWRIVSSFRPCWISEVRLRMICRHSGQWLMRTPQCFAPSVSDHSAPVATHVTLYLPQSQVTDTDPAYVSCSGVIISNH